MTKNEAKKVKVGDTIKNKDGVKYKVLAVNPGWKGFLTSKELELVRDKPDFYYFTVRRSPILQYDHKSVDVVK